MWVGGASLQVQLGFLPSFAETLGGKDVPPFTNTERESGAEIRQVIKPVAHGDRKCLCINMGLMFKKSSQKCHFV